MTNQYKSVIVTLVGLLFLTTTGLVAASPATTQASPLYPIKKAIAAMTVALAAPEDKAAVQANLVDQKVAELAVLNLKIAALEKAQSLDQAKQLQSAADATALAAKQAADKAKADTQLMTDETKKTAVLNQITYSVKQIDDEEGDNVESPEPKETPEPAETPEPKKVENVGKNE